MGWQFTVTVPSWTQTELQNGDLVVFYRVEVKIQQQAPDQPSAPPIIKTRSVLRRFSHFTKLDERLREELGPAALAGKEPPARHSLFSVNKRPELIEVRRRELEQWLWKLVSDPGVARSRTLNKFLELSVAAKLVERAAAAAASSIAEDEQVQQSFGGLGGGEDGMARPHAAAYSEDDGTLSQWNDAASGSITESDVVAISRARAMGSGGATTAAVPHDPGHAVASAPNSWGSGDHPFGGGGGMPYAHHNNGVGGGVGSVAYVQQRMRLGLHVEERSSVKKQVLILKERLDAASNDLAAAVHALHLEQARAGELVNRVQDLEARLAAGVSQREAELEVLLVNQREETLTLAHQLEEQQLAMDLLRQQVVHAGGGGGGEGTAGSVDLVERGHKEQDALVAQRDAALQERDALLAQRDAAQRDRDGMQQQRDSLTQRVADLEAQLHSQQEAQLHSQQEAQAAAQALENKYRADLKVLAKEIKSLRKQLAAAHAGGGGVGGGGGVVGENETSGELG